MELNFRVRDIELKMMLHRLFISLIHITSMNANYGESNETFQCYVSCIFSVELYWEVSLLNI